MSARDELVSSAQDYVTSNTAFLTSRLRVLMHDNQKLASVAQSPALVVLIVCIVSFGVLTMKPFTWAMRMTVGKKLPYCGATTGKITVLGYFINWIVFSIIVVLAYAISSVCVKRRTKRMMQINERNLFRHRQDGTQDDHDNDLLATN